MQLKVKKQCPQCAGKKEIEIPKETAIATWKKAMETRGMSKSSISLLEEFYNQHGVFIGVKKEHHLILKEPCPTCNGKGFLKTWVSVDSFADLLKV